MPAAAAAAVTIAVLVMMAAQAADLQVKMAYPATVLPIVCVIIPREAPKRREVIMVPAWAVLHPRKVQAPTQAIMAAPVAAVTGAAAALIIMQAVAAVHPMPTRHMRPVLLIHKALTAVLTG